MDKNLPAKTIPNVLIVAITPYFLEKGNVWFEENLQKILEARKTQPFFEDNTMYLWQGAKLELSQLLRKLDEMGYEKVFGVQEPGEFSNRGGTLEVFPINSPFAVRIEFLGNTIETIEKLGIEVKDEELAKEVLKKRLKSQKLFSDLKGIQPGDFLVHLDHGVAKFTGLTNDQFLISNSQIPISSRILDRVGTNPKYQIPAFAPSSVRGDIKYYVLEYAGGDKLFVPLGLERKLSRYIGFADPKISRLGSQIWFKTKRRVREEVEKLAKALLELYAQKEVAKRPPYEAPGEIFKAVEDSFPYRETPDQLETLQDIEKDLEKEDPMDRIACGDVGFGKTEIALRTMVRSVEQGYQAALLAPTTILAYQHFQTFTERLKSLPLRVAMLSRLQPKREQQGIVEQIKSGTIDMVLGTHRILSSDIAFKNLGLLVIDDEQRFGVKQKEKLRELRASLDVLSLSATPIPRTLYMALSSLKGISIIQTSPQGRMPIKTTVASFNEKLVKTAVQKELQRGGQVYYLHNRIGTIEAVKKLLEKLVPKTRIGVAHGRIGEAILITMMDDFKNRKYDVLLATTIIENGLDLPNVNTLIVDDAAKLGLAQAYQIRGRVGRSEKPAFAYFFITSRPGEKANLRLKALKEAHGIGLGYQIAMRDLELRGAGNILGKEQSGSINTVGLNLYCQMLSEAVEKMKA
ncbi:MAG: transcription-repair coupling factor [Parcubacteria group bacterium Greene0714_21]|nr:MAG: transcription-repair coupling factor [Parcubacteria group bacterium Greene1014_47]TSD04163.1 MAG: transcription-repair coupling factor [Parcubacteria group bacterium Greene0714_21]